MNISLATLFEGGLGGGSSCNDMLFPQTVNENINVYIIQPLLVEFARIKSPNKSWLSKFPLYTNQGNALILF